MKDLGVLPVSTPSLGYRYDVCHQKLAFSFLIHEPDPYFLKPPTVSILKLPSLTGRKRTHVIEGDLLCYMDENLHYFNPCEPEKAAKDILGFINNTVGRMLSNTMSTEDFNKEFDAYWKPQNLAYIIADDAPLYINTFARTSKLSGHSENEMVIHNGISSCEMKRWSAKRGYENIVENKRENVVTIHLKKSPVPEKTSKNYKWPVLNWPDFINWCSQQGNDTLSIFLESLAKVAMHAKDITIVVSYLNLSGIRHYFGVQILFTRDLRSIAKRDRLARASAKQRGKNNRKLSDVVQMFKSQTTKSFKRIAVKNATKEFIVSRNIRMQSLKNKKIALIGCGTLGSHIAQTLVKIGAGMGENGKISLYDSDTLGTENLARHTLDETYLGEIKSVALKHQLENIGHWDINCFAYPHLYIDSTDGVLQQYDVVIDAVGSIPLSNMLSIKFHALIDDGVTKTTLLHGWIDANGLSTRCLLDDGNYGCVHCLRQNGIDRFPALPKGNTIEQLPQTVSCGESFTPYAESVSLSGASLVINTLLDHLENINSVRLRQIKISNSIPDLKWQNMSKLSTCSVCRNDK
jgi:molybdopterin/thiamine biosynthesis adenylyltransferase